MSPPPTFRVDDLAAAICTGHPELRFDDVAAYLQRELLATRAQAVLIEYPELRGTFFVPLEESPLNPGATHWTYSFEDYVGEAQLGASMSTSPPMVGVTVNEATPIPFRHIEDGYNWSVKELRSSMMANRPLGVRKAEAARKVIANKHDDIILIGDGTAAYMGLTGLFKLSNTNTYTLPNGGSSGTKVWEDKNGEEIVADATAILNKIMTTTNGVEVPNMLALPLSSYTVMATKKMGIDTMETALERFLRTAGKIYPGLMVEQSVKLETAGSGNTKRACGYRRDARKVARLDMVEFEQAPPTVDGFNTKVHCHAESAGVYSPKPKSLCYADGL